MCQYIHDPCRLLPVSNLTSLSQAGICELRACAEPAPCFSGPLSDGRACWPVTKRCLSLFVSCAWYICMIEVSCSACGWWCLVHKVHRAHCMRLLAAMRCAPCRRATQQVAGGPCAGQGRRPRRAPRGICGRDQLHRLQAVRVVRCAPCPPALPAAPRVPIHAHWLTVGKSLWFGMLWYFEDQLT